MQKTNFLKLNYHDNVENNTDEVDAEKYFNENYFTIDANAENTYKKLQNLVSQQPHSIVSGESLHIKDSAEWEENSLSVAGNLKQEKRSGKNFIINTAVSKTENGVQFTVKEDGTVLVNGTATDTIVLKLSSEEFTLEPGDYTLSGCPSGGEIDGTTNYKLDYIIKDTVTNTTAYPSDVGNGNTRTITNISTVTGVRIVIYAGAVLNNLLFKPLLEFGTVASEYETGGVMPSLKFPSMPMTATGVQKIKQFRKNHCKITNVIGYTYASGIPTTQGDIDINEFDTNSLSITSVANAYRIALTNIIQLLPNTEYTLSYIRTNNLTEGSARRYIYSYNKTDGYTLINNLNSNDDGKMSYTFTTDENGTVAIGWGYNNTASGSSSTISNIQIEEGSVATEYEAYQEELYTLDLKNTELCKIVDNDGNVVAQDRAVYRNDKWQWEKNIGKFVFNGTENWRIDDKQSGCNYYSFWTSTGTIKVYSKVVSNLFKEDNTIYATDNIGMYVTWARSNKNKK